MSDIAKVWSGTRGDFAQAGLSLLSGFDLQSAVINSLFTDAQAQPGDAIPDGTTNRRGWWANPTFGSRLWLLDRAKKTQETLRAARDYTQEALQWLVDAQAVARFEVRCEWQDPDQLHVQVTAFKRSGASEAMAFTWVWDGVN